MHVQQSLIRRPEDLGQALASLSAVAPHLVLAFGAVGYFTTPALHSALVARFPKAAVVGCSTAGEIAGSHVHDGTCVVTAIRLDHGRVHPAASHLLGMGDSFAAGERLAREFPREGLVAVFVLGTGVNINGSAVVRGIQSVLGVDVTLSGGLAGDAGAFRQTWTLGSEAVRDDQLVAVAFYGDGIHVTNASYGGWKPFGPARKVTRCEGNVLYELDGERALDIYKRYLGDRAAELPGAGLLFPFEMLGEARNGSGIIRTILGVSDADGSLTLAGDIDPNGYLTLMHASTQALVDGAEAAARRVATGDPSPSSARVGVLVSCVGRKLVMGDRVDEEVEAVAAVLGGDTTLTGFYSNGEISHSEVHGECQLHNQTMTVTWISEG